MIQAVERPGLLSPHRSSPPWITIHFIATDYTVCTQVPLINIFTKAYDLKKHILSFWSSKESHREIKPVFFNSMESEAQIFALIHPCIRCPGYSTCSINVKNWDEHSFEKYILIPEVNWISTVFMMVKISFLTQSSIINLSWLAKGGEADAGGDETSIGQYLLGMNHELLQLTSSP